MMQSEHIDMLATALAKCQLEIQGAEKDSVNPFHKSKYADLHSVRQACREPMGKNGLSFVQLTQTLDDKLMLVTILMHSSGQWIKGILPVPLPKADAQTLGSSLTYCRRYALSAMVGVSVYDDDGEAAQKPVREAEKQQMQVSEQAKEPDFEDLMAGLTSVGCTQPKAVVSNFVSFSAEKNKVSIADVVVSACRSEAMLKKFAAKVDIWQKEVPF